MSQQNSTDAPADYSSDSSGAVDSGAAAAAAGTSEPILERGKTFHLDPGKLIWRDVALVEDGASKPTYFLKASQFTPGKPDLALHETDEKGPVLGLAKLQWARSIKCGIGRDESNAAWTELAREGVVKKSYRFEFDAQTYEMVRAGAKEVEASGAQKMSIGHYKILEVASQKVVATYVTESLGKSKGTLVVAPGIGGKLELLLIIAMLSWREKWRRKKNAGQNRLF